MPKFANPKDELFLAQPATGKVVGLATGTLYSLGGLEIDGVRVVAAPNNSGTVWLYSASNANGGYPLTTLKNSGESILISDCANLNMLSMAVESPRDALCYVAQSGIGEFTPQQNN